MDLLHLIRRSPRPLPWAEGEKIPWHEEAFSRRMLSEHLTQDHELASRSQETIDRHVAWIHENLLEGRPTSILDLGCGPGLYTQRLSRLGHTGRGIDISPASIAYAHSRSDSDAAFQHVLGDIREVELGHSYGLAMFLFGELNVFRPHDARAILERVHAALAPGGLLLLEPQTEEVVRRAGEAGPRFSTHERGLFSDEPHLQLEESHWDPETRTATTRWWIVDARSSQVTRHAQTVQAYDRDAYRDLLETTGFSEPSFHPSLTGEASSATDGLVVLTARRM